MVMHPPTAAHAKIMEKAGAEVAFVGTGGVVGAYTGMQDVGAASLTECVQIAGWVARAVSFPVMIDGDTGHGGIMAVRRLVRECIRAGIAGVRIDDQPIEGKRRTQSAGLEVVPMAQAIARYRAAVDMKNELDPDFVEHGTRNTSGWTALLPPLPRATILRAQQQQRELVKDELTIGSFWYTHSRD